MSGDKVKTKVYFYFFRFLLTTTIILALFLAGLYFIRHQQSAGKRGVQNRVIPILNEIPDFSLTDQSGNPFDSASLKGKIWVADFIFTRCAGPCPKMTQDMAKLHTDFWGEENLRFVSFSVDPEWDKPEKLKNYGTKFQADFKRWSFLTGDKKAIYDLCVKHFHLGVDEADPQESLVPDQGVLHSTKFVLIDSFGRIRGYYDSTEPASLSLLKNDMVTLLKQ